MPVTIKPRGVLKGKVCYLTKNSGGGDADYALSQLQKVFVSGAGTELPALADEAVIQRAAIVGQLREKGVEASSDEKFNTLIPKIADISGGGGDGFLNFTANAKTVRITKRTVSEVFTDSLYPVINASVTVSKEV